MSFTKITDLKLENQKVLIRSDLNVPINDQVITSDARIVAALASIRYALEHNAAVIVMSHLGRPKPGEFDQNSSLAPIAESLSKHLGQKVPLVTNWQEQLSIKPGQVVLCENVRFLNGETENSPGLAKQMAQICDIFVMDAFATIHRSHASTAGIAKFANKTCIGLLVQQELEAVHKFTQTQK